MKKNQQRKFIRAHHMSPEMLAGQLLMPAIYSRFLNRNSAAMHRLISLVRTIQPGGFILFHGHPAEAQEIIQTVESHSPLPLLIGADLERGLRSVFDQGTLFPHAMAFGAAREPSLLSEAARVTAEEARSIGINTVFGPMMDLADDPENTIVNIRAYHSDPEIVSALCRKYVEMIQSYGIACVGKHFPGQGAARTDTHLGLAETKTDLETLAARELLPFRDAVDYGIKGLMAGHLNVPGFKHPATLDRRMLEETIRDGWKYPGVIFSDALEMGAIRKNYFPQEQSIMPVEAGIDIQVMPPDPVASHSILSERIRSDEQFREIVEQSVERIILLKRWIGRQQPAKRHSRRLYKVLSAPSGQALASQAAERSITLLNRSDRWPVSPWSIKTAHHLIFTDHRVSTTPLIDFQQFTRMMLESVETHVNPAADRLVGVEISEDTLIIVSLYVRTFAEHAQVLDWKLIEEHLRRVKKDNPFICLILFGNPHMLRQLPRGLNPDAVLLTYSYVGASQVAAAKAAFGMSDINGFSPVDLPGQWHRNTHRGSRFQLRIAADQPDWVELEALIEQAISNQVFPGCQLLASRQGEVLLHRSYGRHTYDTASAAVSDDTIYDLASLTKVLSTTLLCMQLVEQGVISLDDRLTRYFGNQIQAAYVEVTLADLLSHQSGLGAWEPLYEHIDKGRLDQALTHILAAEPAYIRGSKAIYSDLGFVLLQAILERATGHSCEHLFHNMISRLIDCESLQFNPPEALHSRIAPTGTDVLRSMVIRGEVHDTNCFWLGGACGHAGLFGTASNVAVLGQLVIQKGLYGSHRLFKASTLEQFAAVYNPPVSERALGWDTSSAGGSSGKLFTQGTIGHLGFTGTSLWIDRSREIQIVLLSNRVHPDSQTTGIKDVRRTIHDLIMQKIIQ